MSSDIIQAWAVKSRSDVAFYADEALTKLIRRWEVWRTSCPSTVQRFHHFEGRTYALKWRRL